MAFFEFVIEVVIKEILAGRTVSMGTFCVMKMIMCSSIIE